MVSKAVIPHMRENGGDKIVNIGSGWNLKGGDRAVAYCAAKAGVWNWLTVVGLLEHPWGHKWFTL